MIDLDENAYLLEKGDVVACTFRQSLIMPQVGFDVYVVTDKQNAASPLRYVETLKGDDAKKVTSGNGGWHATVVHFGRAFSKISEECHHYRPNAIYAAKMTNRYLVQELEKETAGHDWYLFDKHKKLREEFPELKGIL